MRPEIVRAGLRDLQIGKRADLERPWHDDQAVDFRRVAAGAADGDRLRVALVVLSLTDGLDQDLQRLPDERLILAQGDRLLRLHDGVAAFLRDLRRYMRQVERHRLRARLRGVGEDADVIELLLPDEVEQGLELRVRLPRIADDEGGAHDQVRQPLPGVIDETARHIDAAGPVHVAQHRRIGVLDRHVEVGQEHIVLGQDVDHAQGERTGVDVEHAQPGEVGHALGNLLQELGQAMLHAEIGAVADGVLGDEDDLPRAAADEVDDLLQDVQGPLAHLGSLDAGDGAEGAGVVATVSHFDVGGRAGLGGVEGSEHSLAPGDFWPRRFAEEFANHVADAEPLAGCQHVVDAGGDVVGVVAERGHAPCGNHHLPILPPIEQFGNGGDRLVARRAEEAAGIDDDDMGVVRIGSRAHATRAEQMIHPIRIDTILGTSQRQNVKGAIRFARGDIDHEMRLLAIGFWLLASG